MPQATHYDAIVLGSSRGGRLLPIALAKAGRKVALIEREHVGGTCVNVGCTPTKTMVASARVAYLARRGADYGVRTGPIAIDLERVRQRKRDIVNDFRSGSERSVRAATNVDLLMGEARFTGPKTLAVTLNDGGTRAITADKIFINTGDRPAVPSIEGLNDV